MLKQKIAEIISTFFYLGRVKFLPIIITPMVAYPFFGLLLSATFYFDKLPFNLPYLDLFTLTALNILIAWAILFFVAVYFVTIYVEKNHFNPPQDILIDQILGQVLTIILVIPIFSAMGLASQYCNLSFLTVGAVAFYFYFFLPINLFGLIRHFTLRPIKKFPYKTTGLDIMMRNVMAAVYAALAEYVILFMCCVYAKIYY